MRQQRFRATIMCLLRAALFVALCGAGRVQNAVVSGRVNDTAGGMIANVAVELINRATQVKLSSVTNVEGSFVFPSVPPGTYEVNARITGFNATRIESVTLEVGQSKTLNMTLSAGDVKQSV